MTHDEDDRAPGRGVNIDELDSEALAEALRPAVEQEHRLVPHPGMTPARLRTHIAVHLVVEDQVRRKDPPQAAAALERLQRAGADRHEAIHLIGRAVTEEFSTALAEEGRYDAERYARRLEALSWPPEPAAEP